jgi:hypothetical protein
MAGLTVVQSSHPEELNTWSGDQVGIFPDLLPHPRAVSLSSSDSQEASCLTLSREAQGGSLRFPSRFF